MEKSAIIKLEKVFTEIYTYSKIDTEHNCEEKARKGYLIFLSRDEWYLIKDDNTNMIKVNFCPWCGLVLNAYASF